MSKILVTGVTPGLMLGFDSVWFGMLLFVMKGVAPPEITIQEICWAVLPNIIFDVISLP